MMPSWSNWARTSVCRPKEIIYPESEEEIVDLVRICYENETPLRIVGAGHSYNDIFCPGETGILISLKKFNALEKVDKKAATATFQAGMRIPRLIRLLKPLGLSLSNLGTNVFDNVAGACAAGYHGSGMAYRIFADHLLSFEIITPSGEKLTITRGDERFDAYAINLGMLGIVVRLTLQCEPFFNLKVVERKMSLEAIEASFEKLLADNDHFKFIWIPHTDIFMVWLGNRSEAEPASGFKKLMTYFVTGVLINNIFHELLLFAASFRRSLVPRINRLMARLLVPENNRSIWESHWGFFLPHLLKQDVVEYAVDIKDTFASFKALMAMIEAKKIFVDTPIEVRFVKKDGYWMSPAYGRDSCYIGTKIHFPFGKRPPYFRYFSEVDRVMLRFGGRPHWGKQFRIKSEDFRANYEKWDNFWNLVDREDPKGILTNGFIRRLRGLRG